MNDYIDLSRSLHATEIDWITIRQLDEPRNLAMEKVPKFCKNETLRLELRKAIQRNVKNHCTHYNDNENNVISHNDCDRFIYRIAFKETEKVRNLLKLKKIKLSPFNGYLTVRKRWKLNILIFGQSFKSGKEKLQLRFTITSICPV